MQCSFIFSPMAGAQSQLQLRLDDDLFCQIPLIELRTIKQIKDTADRRKVSLQTLSE